MKSEAATRILSGSRNDVVVGWCWAKARSIRRTKIESKKRAKIKPEERVEIRFKERIEIRLGQSIAPQIECSSNEHLS